MIQPQSALASSASPEIGFAVAAGSAFAAVGGNGCVGDGCIALGAGAEDRSCVSCSFNRVANWFMSCAAVAWIMPTPRPYCATAPDSARLVCTTTLEPTPAG